MPKLYYRQVDLRAVFRHPRSWRAALRPLWRTRRSSDRASPALGAQGCSLPLTCIFNACAETPARTSKVSKRIFEFTHTLDEHHHIIESFTSEMCSDHVAKLSLLFFDSPSESALRPPSPEHVHFIAAARRDAPDQILCVSTLPTWPECEDIDGVAPLLVVGLT